MEAKIIGIFTNTQVKTGAHKRYIMLLEELSKRGHKVVVLSPMRDLNISFNIVHISKNYYKALFEIITYGIKHKSSYSKILVFGFKNAVAASILKILTNKQLFVSIRDYLEESRELNGSNSFIRKNIFNRLEKFIYNQSNIVFLQTRYHKDYIEKKYHVNTDKIVVVPNNIQNPLEMKAENAATNEVLKILFVGSMIKRKGLEYLLEALYILNQNNIKIKCNILGDGKLLNQYKKDIENLHLDQQVTIVGFRKDIAKYYREADVVVVPSIHDAFPNVVLESLNYNCIVIGSNVPGIKDILESKSLLFEVGDSKQIANSLEKITVDSEYKKRLQKLCDNKKKSLIFDWVGEFEKKLF